MIPSIGPLDRLYLNEFSIYDLLVINVLKVAENSSAIVYLFELMISKNRACEKKSVKIPLPMLN